jgi:DNA polymerase-4
MDKYFDPYQWTIDLRQEIIDKTQLPISFGLSSNKLFQKLRQMKQNPMGIYLFNPGEKENF